MAFPVYGLIGFGLVAGVAIPCAASIKFPSYLLHSLPIAFILVGGSIATWILYRFKNYRAVLFLLVGMVVGGYFYTFRVILPVANPHMSARLMSEEITTRIQPGNKLAIFEGLGTDPYNYYTGIVPIPLIRTEGALLDFIRSSERAFCLLKFRDFSQFFNTEGKPKVVLIARRQVRRDDVVLISNR